MRQRLAWLTHARFVLGVSGIILDASGRVLLLQHRFWKGQRWGLPGGLANAGETLAATLHRELWEETGLDIEPQCLLQVRTGFRLRAEFILLARCQVPNPRPCSVEILEARFHAAGELPGNLLPSHRILLESFFRGELKEGLALDA